MVEIVLRRKKRSAQRAGRREMTPSFISGCVLCVCLISGAAALSTPPITPADRRSLVVAALKRFDQLAAMSSRGDPDGCSTALDELAALEAAGVAFELGPNAYNRAMRVCATLPCLLVPMRMCSSVSLPVPKD